MIYAQPGSKNSIVDFKSHYDNYIGGKWVKPLNGDYFDNTSPVNGQVYCKVARSTGADIDLALDAAHSVRAMGQNQCDRTIKYFAQNRRSHRTEY